MELLQATTVAFHVTVIFKQMKLLQRYFLHFQYNKNGSFYQAPQCQQCLTGLTLKYKSLSSQKLNYRCIHS